MPQLPGNIRKERAARLREAGDAAVARHLSGRVGVSDNVLVEQPGFGRTEGFAPVRTPEFLSEGAIATLRLTGIADNHLLAEAA